MARNHKAVAQAVRTFLEPLESRRLLTTIHLDASGGSNAFNAAFNPTTGNVDFYINGSPGNGTPVQSVAASGLSVVSVEDTDASADTFTANVSGLTFSLDASAAYGLSVRAAQGNVDINSTASLGSLSVGDGGILTHNSGALDPTALTIDSGGTFVDSGGTLGHRSGVTINNRGTFEAKFAGSLAGTTGTFNNGGLFIEDVGVGNTNAIGMSLVNNGMSFDLVSGTVDLTDFTPTPQHLQIDGSDGTLEVPSYAGWSSEVTQTGGTFKIDGQLLIAGVSATDGVYNMLGGTINAESMLIANYRTGTFNQSGGTITVSGTADIGLSGTGATWTVTGGTDTFGTLNFGDWSSGTSTWDFSGGSITAGATWIGEGGTAVVDISGTASLSTGYQTILGAWSGNCTINQSGGTWSIADLHLGNPYNSTAIYNLSGGTLDAGDEYLGINADYPADQIHSTLHQTGGTNRTNALIIGNAPGGSSEYQVDGGTLITTWCWLGDRSEAKFSQTAGRTTIGSLFVGLGSDTASTFAVSGGSIAVQGNAYIGFLSSGDLDVSGGDLAVAGSIVVTGDAVDGDNADGHGTAHLSGTGHITTSNLFLGYGGPATLSQDGGTFDISGYYIYNGPSGSTGTYIHTGGTLTAANTINVQRPSASGAAVVNEGSPYGLSLNTGGNGISHWQVDWGDTLSDSIDGSPPTAGHIYSTAGSKTIHAIATANGRPYPSDPVNVLVNDVPANIGAMADLSNDAGQTVSFSTTFTDAGTSETHTATIDWGDGTTSTFGPHSDIIVNESAGKGTVAAKHTYAKHGSYTATLYLTDSAGAVGTAQIAVNIAYVAPKFSLAAPSASISIGQATTLNLSAMGTESNAVTSWTIDWGDGTTKEIDTDHGTVSGSGALLTEAWTRSHVYAHSGVYAITAWAIDSAPDPHRTNVANVMVLNASPPTIAQQPSADASPVTCTTTQLSALGASVGGEGNLTYTWEIDGKPDDAADPAFSDNGTNSAKQTTVTFTSAGTYTFDVVVSDGAAYTLASIKITVAQTPTSISAVAESDTINENGSDFISAEEFDQFGNPLETQPDFTWTVLSSASVGLILPDGTFTASEHLGTAELQAANGNLSANVSITVANAAPTIRQAATASETNVRGATTVLSAEGDDDGDDADLTYTWIVDSKPQGAADPLVEHNDTNQAHQATVTFYKAGDYAFHVVISDGTNDAAQSSDTIVTVHVDATPTSIDVTPQLVTLLEGRSYTFQATVEDQFNDLVGNPAVNWSLLSGTGVVDATGIYTAGAAADTATIQASDGDACAIASIVISASPHTLTKLSATASAEPNVQLTWNDNSGGTSGFQVQRRTDGWGPWGDVAELDPTVTSFTDTTVAVNTRYFYRIMISENGGSLTYSNEATVIVPNAIVITGTTFMPVTGQSYSGAVAKITSLPSSILPESLSPTIDWGDGTNSSGTLVAAAGSGYQVVGTHTYLSPDNAPVLVKIPLTMLPPLIALSHAIITNAPLATTATATATIDPLGTQIELAFQANDPGNPGNLSYRWTLANGPAAVTYTENNTFAAGSTTAILAKCGTYTFNVSAQSSDSRSVTGSVTIDVSAIPTNLSVIAPQYELHPGQQIQMSVKWADQFGMTCNPPPQAESELTWTETWTAQDIPWFPNTTQLESSPEYYTPYSALPNAAGTIDLNTLSFTAPTNGTGNITVTCHYQTRNNLGNYVLGNYNGSASFKITQWNSTTKAWLATTSDGDTSILWTAPQPASELIVEGNTHDNTSFGTLYNFNGNISPYQAGAFPVFRYDLSYNSGSIVARGISSLRLAFKSSSGIVYVPVSNVPDISSPSWGAQTSAFVNVMPYRSADRSPQTLITWDQYVGRAGNSYGPLTGYSIFRYDSGPDPYIHTHIADVPAGQISYIDTIPSSDLPAVAKYGVSYAVVPLSAEDPVESESELKSDYSSGISPSDRIFLPLTPPVMPDFSATPDDEKQSVTLTWSAPPLLFRNYYDRVKILWSADGVNYSEIDNVRYDKGTYTDDEASPGDDYYKIVTYETPIPSFESDGQSFESAPSAIAHVNLVAEPVAVNDGEADGSWDKYVTPVGKAIEVLASVGVLANDIDPQGLDLEVADHSEPAHGTLDIQANGKFTYTPNIGFHGIDSFTYDVTNGTLKSRTATVAIDVKDAMVTPADDAYTASSGGLTISSNGASSLGANDDNPDGCSVQYKLVSDVSNGHLQLNTDGGFIYTPASGFAGPDSFVYQVTNGDWTSPAAGVTLQVNSAVAAPATTPQSFESNVGGLWQSYQASLEREKQVAVALADFGRVSSSLKAIDEGNPASEKAIDAAILKLDAVYTAYNHYSNQLNQTLSDAGAFERSIYVMSIYRRDVLKAIMDLPTDIPGVRANYGQLQKDAEAVASFRSGAEWMVANSSFTVTMAQDTHDALDTALAAGGVASIGIAAFASATELLTEQGCAAFAKAAATQIMYTAGAVGVGYGGNQVLSKLGDKFGVDKQYMQIGADFIQLVFLLKAARQERIAQSANCFVAGTEVLVAESNGKYIDKPIEDVAVGDMVLSRDQNDPNGPLVAKKVTYTYDHQSYDLQKVSVKDLATGEVQTFNVTASHPFYVEGQGWTPSEDLLAGNKLLTASGCEAVVTDNGYIIQPLEVTVYNFTVEGDHTYFVGDGTVAIWVHNTYSPYDFPTIPDEAGFDESITKRPNHLGKFDQDTELDHNVGRLANNAAAKDGLGDIAKVERNYDVNPTSEKGESLPDYKITLKDGTNEFADAYANRSGSTNRIANEVVEKSNYQTSGGALFCIVPPSLTAEAVAARILSKATLINNSVKVFLIKGTEILPPIIIKR